MVQKGGMQYFIIPASALIHQGNKEAVSYAGLFIYVRLFEHEFYIFNRKPYKILYSFIFVSCNSAYFAVSLKRQDILLLNIFAETLYMRKSLVDCGAFIAAFFVQPSEKGRYVLLIKVSSFPENSVSILPDSSGCATNASCFSAVMPVSG